MNLDAALAALEANARRQYDPVFGISTALVEECRALEARVEELETQLAAYEGDPLPIIGLYDAAVARIEAVRALHREHTCTLYDEPDFQACTECEGRWPCDTISALAAVPPETPKEET